MKKKTIITIVIIVAVVLAIYLWFKSAYNGMVQRQETVYSEWAKVQADYQRRADLIPNLEQIVKGAAKHESSTFTAVTEARQNAFMAREKAAAANNEFKISDATPEQLQAYEETQNELNNSLKTYVNVTVEAYPTLQANENFLEFQSQLEGTENRIKNARNKFTEAVQNYNQYIRMFPKNILAGMFGFEKMDYYTAKPGSEEAPKINFTE